MQQWQIEQLKKQLSELAPVCFACGLSEEETMCDILVDSKCYQGICAICLKKKESENCTKCTLKMGEHHKKSRGYSKDPLLDYFSRKYLRYMKLRSTYFWNDLDPDLLNLLAYFNSHPSATRKKYEDFERYINKILQNNKRKKNEVYGDDDKRYHSAYIKTETDGGDGRYACGYESNYYKGLSFIYRAFFKSS